MQRSHILLSLLGVFCLNFHTLQAQPGYEVTIKKPEPYENRVLRAEKSGQKKFTAPRRFFQNTYTHYNYFFNAHNKLNTVIEKAKEAHKDDYSDLISFYNYSLETTAQDKTELDSVIYKTKTGILMHDLRNEWIDDLYLLWGASYFLQQKFDSAYQMFQFINYAFAEKEKDGYYKYIGSSMDGNTALSIATKENAGLLKRMVSDPPSRNTAFIWQIRTLIESNAFPEAGSLIVTLRKDPNFPERLQSSLDEVQAYWFYKQNMWDSAAHHLTKALDNAATKQERSRWEYLAAQLFERANKFEEAEDYYTKSISHTIDPVLDVYARLNLIRINKTGGDNYIDQNIAELLKMAKKEKFTDYRDVIYFMAARMEMQRHNTAAAEALLLKGSRYFNNNITSRNRSYLQLADLFFIEKKYIAAASFYDSVQVNSLRTEDGERVTLRKEALSKVVRGINTLNQQDSLQRIAAMPETERTDYLKKLVRQLRRQQGLKEEENATSLNTGFTTTASTDIFSTPAKGEWYFYNPSLKTQGAAAFKKAWGNRPNVDNWRRASDVTAELRTNVPENTRGNPVPGTNVTAGGITYDNLLNGLPLTQEQLKVSNEQISTALLSLGNTYLNDIEDYASAIQAYEELRKRFPDYFGMSEVLFNLYYSYIKAGDTVKAEEIKKLLQQNYPTSRETVIINTGTDPKANKPTAEVTKVYEGIYDLFIEGRFEEALTAKQQADSLYHTNYWSPQLLYIEAVYYVKQREDSTAVNTLKLIQQQNPNTPLAAKAANLQQVLSRRKQIEEELTNLQIERPQEDTTAVTTQPVVIAPVPKIPSPVIKKDTTVIKKEITAIKTDTVAAKKDAGIKRDTTAIKKEVAVKPTVGPKVKTDTLVAKPPPPRPASIYSYDANAPHYVMIVLNKVDNVFGNEARNAFNRYNREKYYNQSFNIQLVNLDADNRLLLIGNFANVLQATDYVQKAKPISATEIIPWLKSNKYSFSVISEANLEVLKNNPDLEKYKKFLEQSSQVKW
jgi:tetratricopeptide (TPR) repeat protein